MQNGRVGAFLAVNNGTVEGCVADVSFFSQGGGAGFVYENNAKISNSVSLRCVKGKQAKGFYVRNGGTITASGYVASRKTHKSGKNEMEEYIFGNAELYISDDTPTEEILRMLDLDKIWQGTTTRRGGFFPDIVTGMHPISVANDKLIRLENAEDVKHMIESINSGDKKAASAHYLLTNNIDMKGTHLRPIGDSESYSFSGKFDGNGKTISNFTTDCRGSEYGGFFGYIQNAEVANLALDYILKGNGGVPSAEWQVASVAANLPTVR